MIISRNKVALKGIIHIWVIIYPMYFINSATQRTEVDRKTTQGLFVEVFCEMAKAIIDLLHL